MNYLACSSHTSVSIGEREEDENYKFCWIKENVVVAFFAYSIIETHWFHNLLE